MKKNIRGHFAIYAILFFACSKSNHSSLPTIGNKTVATPTSAVFTFSVNDTTYDFSGTASDQYSQIKSEINLMNSDTTWNLEASFRPISTNMDGYMISFYIGSPTITTTTYSGTSNLSVIFSEPGFYNANANNDLVSLTITTIHDSLVDGNFACHLTPYGTESINGRFKNVPIK